MTPTERRIDRVLSPEYLGALDERTDDQLREMKAEASEVETEVSYVRRLAQGRLDILGAERARRDEGKSLGDLIAELPRILAPEGGRPAPAKARLGELLAPSPDIAWSRGLESLIEDNTLARLPDLTDEQLESAREQLEALERDMSERRKQLHDVIDALERAIAGRVARA